jgi:Mg-chelatase subunit ChlD
MRVRRVWPLLCIVVISAALPVLVLAQTVGGGLMLFINGIPDARTAPPSVRTFVSVIDRGSGRVIEGLTGDDFVVEEAASPIADLAATYESVGLAAVIVIDRGGISRRGDTRIKEATELSRAFLARLTVDDALTDDMVAIVGVNDDENAQLSPVENFTHNPVDKNLVGNALTRMEGETVDGGTPLYEGLDHAIALLTENAMDAIRSELRNRRKFIIVFSDGVDKSFSDEAREQDIIRKAEDHAILIYTIGMAPRSGLFGGADNLKRLAAQTDGLYTLYPQGSAEAHEQVTALFDRIITQRYQYLLAYETHQPKGEYQLEITVETATGSAEQSRTFSSILELPRLMVAVDPDLTAFTLPYSKTLGGPEPLELTLRTVTSFVDGVERAPMVVRYYANGDQVGESDVPPDFAFTWDAGSLRGPGSTPVTETYTLIADAVDPYLTRSYAVDIPVKVQITWGEKPLVPQIEEQATQNWWLILVLLAIIFGLVLLMLMLIRTRSQLANKVVKGATGFLKGVTRPLSTPSRRAPGKLVIQRGANVGREYDLSAPVVKVGRDTQFSDVALNDEYISNPHFSIHLEGTQFYVMDEGSTNGTQLNGMRLQPHQRIPLSPDAVIELGQTRLQFRQLGLPTQHLDLRGWPGAPGPHNPQHAPRGEPQRPPAPEKSPPNPYVTGPIQAPPKAAPPPNPYLTQKVGDDE